MRSRGDVEVTEEHSEGKQEEAFHLGGVIVVDKAARDEEAHCEGTIARARVRGTLSQEAKSGR